MMSRITLLRILLPLLLAGTCDLVHADANQDSNPTITGAGIDGTNLVVRAHVPAGFHSITLESRVRIGRGTWAPRGVMQLDGTASDVVFRVPPSADLEIMRLRLDASTPLPANFYTSVTNFIGAPTNVVPAGPTSGIGAGAGGVLPGTTVSGGSATTRSVVESDIWTISGTSLYFFNQWRGLQVVDISNPDSPALRGTLSLPAAGEQMYLTAADHVVLLANVPDASGYNNSQAILVDTSRSVPITVTNLPISGWIQDSRLVGTALYVVSQSYRPLAGSADTWEWGSLVSSFDLSNFKVPVARGSIWITGYANVVMATDRFLFVANQGPNYGQTSTVNVIDIQSPDGSMQTLSTINTAGVINDKFKLNFDGNIFTAISENWTKTVVTVLQNFSLANPSLPQKVGSLAFAPGETLQATRFDSHRAYVATGVYTDPITVIDLSDPAHPAVSGTVALPGYSTFIQPLGDRLVTLGVVSNRVAVSLFDVSAAPKFLSQVFLGENYSWSEANWDDKAFTVLPDIGLILVPYEGYATNGYSTQVQLIDLGINSLTLRGQIAQAMMPRRAAAYLNRILSLSGWDLLDVDPSDRDHPKVLADLQLAWPVDRVFVQGANLVQVTYGNTWGFPNAPVIHVTSADATDKVLATLSLTNLPIIGSAVLGTKLYLAQAPGTFFPFLLGADPVNGGAPDPTLSTFVFTVIDLGQLPQLTILGQTTSSTQPFGWGARLDAFSTSASVLVWAGQNNYFWPVGLALPSGGPLPAGGIAGSGILPWPGFSPPGKHLLAFDVSNSAAPALKSEIIINPTNAWSFGNAFTTNSLIYFSHQTTEFIPSLTPPPTDGSTTGTPSGSLGTTSVNSDPPTPIYGTWMQQNNLDVVDYADPTTPTIRPPVKIPGELKGIGAKGSLLYTIGAHWSATDWWNWTQFLDASAYDGVTAHLIDSLSLSNSWPYPVLTADAYVLIGKPQDWSSTNGPPPALDTWTIDASGHFAKLASLTLTSSADTLATVPGLILIHEVNGQVGLADIVSPFKLINLQEFPPPGNVWPDVMSADGAAGVGVWIPLGGYGVMTHAAP